MRAKVTSAVAQAAYDAAKKQPAKKKPSPGVIVRVLEYRIEPTSEKDGHTWDEVEEFLQEYGAVEVIDETFIPGAEL